MALNLQINTTEAADGLERVKRQISDVVDLLSRVPSTANIEQIGKQLSTIQGIPAAAAQSVQQFAQGLAALSSAGSINNVVSQLQRLTTIDPQRLVQGMNAVNAALRTLVVPAALQNLSQLLDVVARSASSATQSVNGLRNSMAGIQVPPGLAGFAAQAQAAQGATLSWGSALGVTSGLLAAFGIQASVKGLADFVKGTIEAVNMQDKFNSVMRTTTTSSAEVAKEWQFVVDVSNKYATSLSASADAYGKFALGAQTAGFTLKETHKLFDQFSLGFRAYNLSIAETERSWQAVVQIMSKGKVSLEELRRQLGQNIPAFALMAQGMGISTAALEKMISAGLVGVKELKKLGDAMESTLGVAADAASKTFSAAMTRLDNSWTIVQLNFGRGMTDFLIPAIDNLAKAMAQPGFQTFATFLGQLTGLIGNALINLLAALADDFAAIGDGASKCAAWFQRLGDIIVAWGQTVGGVISAVGNVFVELWKTMTFDPTANLTGALTKLSNAYQNFGHDMNNNLVTIIDTRENMDRAKEATDRWNSGLTQTSSGLNSVNQAAKNATGGLHSAAGGMNSVGAAARGATSDVYELDRALEKIQMDGRRGVPGAGNIIPPAGHELPITSGDTYFNGPTGDYSSNSGAGPGDTGYGPDTFGNVDGGSFDMPGSYRKGGIAGAPFERMSVSPSVFIGARHFAEGGLSDGGIPAILHSDEAVVPLQGGAIPVTGAGFPSSAIAIGQQTLLGVRSVNQSIKDTQQTIINVGVLLHADFEKAYGCLRRLEGLASQMISAIGHLGVSSSGGVSGGGTGGTGTAARSGGGKYNGLASRGFDSELASMGIVAGGAGSIYGAAAPYSAAAYGGGPIKVGGFTNSDPAPNFDNMGNSNIQDEHNQDDPTYGNYASNAGTNSYALGTPNTSGEGLNFGSGAAMVGIHPNEAVIPLPDGRSVPIDDGGVLSRIDAFITSQGRSTVGADASGSSASPAAARRAREESTPGASGGMRPVNVTNYFNIQTPNPGAFRDSQDQIMRDLALKMKRSLKNIGAGDLVDDPTLRSTK